MQILSVVYAQIKVAPPSECQVAPHVVLRDFETKMADRRRRRRNSSHSDSDHSETEEAEAPKVVERKTRNSECVSAKV